MTCYCQGYQVSHKVQYGNKADSRVSNVIPFKPPKTDDSPCGLEIQLPIPLGVQPRAH